MQAKRIEEENEDNTRRYLRTITNHISGTVRSLSLLPFPKLTKSQDGRCPFEEDEESAILEVLRQKKPWPCFPPEFAHFGQRYRARGYHEKLQEQRHKKRLTEEAFMMDNSDRADADMVAQNIAQIIEMMDNEEDAAFALNRCTELEAAFGASLTLDDRENVCRVLRYTFLSRMPQLRTETPYGVPQMLCEKFDDGGENKYVTVMDLTANSFHGRVVAQNQVSLDLVGDLTQASQFKLVKRNDFLRIMIGLVACHLRPGLKIPIYRQELLCGETQKSVFFDMTFEVDPESFLYVLHGRQSDE